MAKSSGGSNKLLWVMVVLLILSLTISAAALYMVFSQPDPATQAAAETEAAAEEEESEEPEAPVFLEIEPFTVNLADDEYGPRLLYAGITLKVAEEDDKAVLEQHLPEVRSRLITTMSGRRAEELTAAGGKEDLSNEVIAALEAPLSGNQKQVTVNDVLFTEFIVQ